MDIDTIIALILLGIAALLAAFQVGRIIGEREGFESCSDIWSGHGPHKKEDASL